MPLDLEGSRVRPQLLHLIIPHDFCSTLCEYSSVCYSRKHHPSNESGPLSSTERACTLLQDATCRAPRGREIVHDTEGVSTRGACQHSADMYNSEGGVLPSLPSNHHSALGCLNSLFTLSIGNTGLGTGAPGHRQQGQNGITQPRETIL